MNHDDPHTPAAQPAPLVPPPPLPPSVPVLLADVAPGRELAGTPVTIWDGDTVVVLDYDPGDVALSEVWSLRDGTRVLPTHTLVTPVPPDERAVTALRRALAHLLEWVHNVTTNRSVDRAHHQRVLEDIRNYAIDRHLDGCYDREDLDHFLHRFDLARYQPRYTVAFTISGTYQVEANSENDEKSVGQDAEDTLRPDLRFTPWTIDGTEDYDVAVNDITREDERADSGT